MSVRWKWLELFGFGPHDELFLEFPAGLGAFVAPNERGKSTALAGLTATVFGLPTSSDETAWGQARFRSHRVRSRFEGSVAFTALDGETYQIRRNFETHALTLTHIAPSGAKVVFQGDHNPSARKRTGQYEAALERLIGLTSAELFNATFCVEQQPSAQGLAHDVSALLAGSGGGSHDVALRTLEAEIVRRTKLTKQYGLPGNNKSKDRELEEIEGQINETRAAIRDGAAAADGLLEINEALRHAQQNEQKMQAETRTLETKIGAVSTWLDAKEHFERQQRMWLDLKKQLDHARSAQAQIDIYRSEGAEVDDEAHPRWRAVDGSALAYLRERRADAEVALREMSRFEDARGALRDAQAERSAYALFDEASPALREALSVYEAQREEHVRALRHAREDLARAEKGAEGFADVATLSEAQIAALRKAASARTPLPLLLAAVGVLVGWLTFQFSPLGLPLSGALGFVLGVLGFTLGRQASRGKRGDAARTLERLAAWQARQSDSGSNDVQTLRRAAEVKQRDLEAFDLRFKPFSDAFSDLPQAVADYDDLRRTSAARAQALDRTAQDVWHVGADEVTALDPQTVPGHWRRLATFARAVEQDASSVASLYGALTRLEATAQWATLGQDADAWDKQRSVRDARLADLSAQRATLKGILQAASVNSVGELEQRVDKQALAATEALSAFRKVCDTHPELPRHDDEDAGREGVLAKRETYEGQVRRSKVYLEMARDEIFALRGKQADIQGKHPVNIAAKEVEVAELEAARNELERDIAAYAHAYSLLQSAVRDYQDTYLERLSEASTTYFNTFTGVTERRVDIQPDFQALVVAANGTPLQPVQLSQGAQDQLALAVRLAVADLIADDLPLPLVFDDPFLNCDASRLARIKAALEKMAETRQVLVLSHEPAYREWGDPVEEHALSR